MSNIPKLRFPEFTDAWEKCKLEKYLEVSNEKNINNKYSKQEVLSVSGEFGIINQIEFKGRSFAGASVEKYSVVDTGDIVYTKSPLQNNPYGIIKTNKGIAGIVSTLYAVYHPKKDTDPEFVQTYFDLHSRTNNYLAPLVNKGAKNDMKISSENALKGFVTFPKFSEQQKIGNLFKQLDRLITLHKRKWDDVILLKKALLQKMFPKNGSDFPALRFPEFTDAWEKCKLGEIATINPKSTLPQTFNYVDLESVVGTEMRSYKIEKLYSAPSRAQRLAKYGDIFYQTVRPYQKNNYLFELDDENYVFSTGYAQIRSKIYPYFLFTLIQNDRFVNEVLDNCTGTSYPAINATDLKNITIFISNNPIEQQKIGNLFKQLDRLITLHKRQHEHYQLLKKALLQQMFV
ncbi:restriction endonuclease subunit S [Gallibacterium anatis]|uniref:restriction endonuclease subunit S n=1 Tax=Gallibacterium anatis TaxID=750 RepID=UPI003006F736